MSFSSRNTTALLLGIVAGFVGYCLLSAAEWPVIAAIALSGYLGFHLPYIQQPSSPAYQRVRMISMLAALLLPLQIYAYRPTDLLLAWVATYLLFHGAWWIIDRVSLHRDYTRSVSAIIVLPMVVAGCAYSSLGAGAALAVFLASSASYILYLLIEQHYNEQNSSSIIQD